VARSGKESGEPRLRGAALVERLMRRTRTTLRLRAAAVGAAAVAIAGVAWACLAAVQPAAGAPAGKPNIVLVVTDDQRLDEFDKRIMPATKRLIGGKGTTFTDTVVTTPTCCPSRATMLTGQYGHNNGVLANAPGYRALVEPQNTLPVWLQRAGYRTAHLGKYLNGYQGAVEVNTEVAPGWNAWYTLLTPRRYYGYNLAVNGSEEGFGNKDGDHFTRVINRQTARVIRRFSNGNDPFYVQVDQFAPHTESGRSSNAGRCTGGAVPDPRDTDLFEKVKPPETPSYNEQDVTDKPSFISGRGLLAKKQQRAVARRIGCRLASLRGVDRGVKKMVQTLKQEDELDNTVIIFTSDNGYFGGEHRIAVNKTFPYEEALRLPLAVRVPPSVAGGRQPKTVKKLVSNIDLAPTILDLAGGEPCIATGCRVMDGRSLVRLLKGGANDVPDDRSLLIEYGRDRDKAGLLCEYAGIRDPTRVYMEYTAISNGVGCDPIDEGELYDLRLDPFQLNNLFRPNGGQGSAQARLEAKLDELRSCAGIAGRDPQPAGGSYCE
jgi:N-acetylglucosamine-6-sulfatase